MDSSAAKPQPKTFLSGAAAAPAAQSMLDGPILPTLLRLAAPNVVVTFVLALVSGIDAFYIGRLGPEALAGISLTFPMIMIMQTMAVGGIGGGIASAVARAVGAGNTAKANALAVHALLIGAALAVTFTVAMLTGGEALYRALGGSGESLKAALAYSNVFFSGAIVLWLFQMLSAVLRGVGNMGLPAVLLVGGEIVHVALAPALIFGVGPIPSMGVAGAALSSLSLILVRALILIRYFLSERSRIRLTVKDAGLQPGLFWEILRVGIPSSVGTIVTNLNILFVTSFVGLFGAYALAGYGIGARLEYLLAPIVFGLGSALVTMVGTNVGAGKHRRALDVAWTGATLAAVITGGIGIACAYFAKGFMQIFTAEPAAVKTGVAYLHIAGPAYLFFGAGLALYFSSQGAGRPKWPFIAALVRFALTAGGGWLAIHWLGAGLDGLFYAVSFAFVVFGSLIVFAVGRGAFGRA